MKFPVPLALLIPAALVAQVPAPSDTQGKTLAGVAYVQSKDWVVSSHGAVTVFMAPERNLSVAVIDIGKAADAKEAAAKAWVMFKPNVTRTVRISSPSAPGEGWDERVTSVYETSPSERAVAMALALRHGAAWTVMITDGLPDGVDRPHDRARLRRLWARCQWQGRAHHDEGGLANRRVQLRLSGSAVHAGARWPASALS